MQQKSFLGHSLTGFHRIAYTEWGKAGPLPPVICVHGLTRNSRDFDKLATALAADGRHVFCPDIPGRGQSEWLSDPANYTYPQYANDMTAFIARIDAASVDWAGTSMGGILGMLMAAQPGSPIRRLIINDVGPFISLESLQRINSYLGLTPEFADLDQAERYVRQIYAPFGITEDKDWRDITEHSMRKLPNGKLMFNYDPHITDVFKSIDKDVDLWESYDRIRCPVMVIRGMQSDLLSNATAQEMTQRGPKAQLVEVPNVGHAPALMDLTQIGIIRDFLGGEPLAPRPKKAEPEQAKPR